MFSYPAGASGPFTTTGFSTMSDRKPDKGFSSDRIYLTSDFESESGYEKSRLRSRRPKRNYNLTYTNIDGLIKTSIENFYHARSGNYEAFVFDLDHVSETGNITVKFDGALSITHILTSGSNLLNSFYTVTFKLKETYD